MDIRKLAQQMQMEPDHMRILEEAMERERLEQRQQQAEGIAQAKARGVRFGRPRTDISDIAKLYTLRDKQKLSLEECARLYGVSRSTVYRRLREYEARQISRKA